MLAFEANKAAIVVRDTQTAFSNFDAAFRSTLDLASSFLDVSDGSNMTARDSQKLMQAVHDSAGDVLAGRAKMVAATAILLCFQKDSNLAETGFGCPGPGPWMSSAADGKVLAAVA